MNNQIVCFLFISLLISCIANSSNNDHLPNTIIRKDNSFVSYIDSLSEREKTPTKVFQKITEIIDMNFYETKYEKDKIDAIFKIKYNNYIDIYIIRMKSFGVLYYAVLGYNPSTDALTLKPIYFDGKSMANNEAGFRPESRLLKEPLLYFEDIDIDGNKEIIIKKRVHNGTVYNAVIESYYSIDNKLNISLLLAIEPKYKHIYHKGCLVTRDLEKNIIKVGVKCKGDEILDVGEVYISYQGNQVRIDSSKLFIEEYEGLLVTGSGLEEEVFLNNGYKFAY